MPGPGAGATRYVIEGPGGLVVKLPSEPWVAEEFQGQTVSLDEFFASSQTMLAPGDYSKAFAAAVLNQLRREFPETLTAGGTTTTEGGEQPGAGGFEETLTQFIEAFADAGAEEVDPAVSAAQSFYVQLWGTEAPKGYIERYFKAGGDLYDFQEAELSRPGARQTNYYQDRAYGYANRLAQIFGRGFS